MKIKIVLCIMACSAMLILTGLDLSLQTMDIGASSAYAWGHKGGYQGDGTVGNAGGPNGNTSPDPGKELYSVPEPSLLALAIAGIAGFGVYGVFRGRKKE